MRTVELKLAYWRRVYGELNDTEQRLREARTRGPQPSAAEELQARVKRLQQESNRALDEVHAALAARAARAAAP